MGLSLRDAFQGCIGEGIEYLSQLQAGKDMLVAPGPDDPAAGLGPQTREFLAAFSARRNWLLDITTDIGVPCVAAVSCMADGFGFAFSLAARPTLSGG